MISSVIFWLRFATRRKLSINYPRCPSCSCQKNKIAFSGDNSDLSTILERFYAFARTRFAAGEPSELPRWTPQDNLRQAKKRKR